MIPTYSQTIADTQAHSVPGAFAFAVEADAVISALTGSLTGFAGVTYKTGRTVFANFTSITLASGTVTIYKY